MHDHRPLALLDRVREDGERGREGPVSAREDVDVGALGPGDVRGMDRRLDLWAVKVDGRLGLEERAGEAEDVPENGPGVEDAVDVECWVYGDSGVEDHVPDVAPAVGLGAPARQREQALRRVSEMLLHVVGIVASGSNGIELGHERLAVVA